MDQGSPKIKLL